MKISRDVVKDLLPLYTAGEASADTRALVEEFLGQDPELTRLFKTAQRQQATLRGMAQDGLAAGGRPEDSARAGLRQTQRLIALRTWLLASAIFFTLLPGSFRFTDTVVWVMWRDMRPLAELSLGIGALSWAGFWWSRRRLRVTGL